MIVLNLKGLMAEKSKRERRTIRYSEISQVTGINQSVLSRMGYDQSYNITKKNIELLCKFFGVGVGKLLLLVSDPKGGGQQSAA